MNFPGGPLFMTMLSYIVLYYVTLIILGIGFFNKLAIALSYKMYINHYFLNNSRTYSSQSWKRVSLLKFTLGEST